MKNASEQLHEEGTYRHLATFPRFGGTLEVGENVSLGPFARIRKGNYRILVDAVYRDFAAALKKMDSRAKWCLQRESG